MRPQQSIADVALAINAASALTESRFVPISEALGTSIELLTTQAKRFEAVLEEFRSENLGQALKALSRTAMVLAGADDTWSGGCAGLDDLLALTEAVAGRIARMTASLGDVNALAINAKIAAAHIQTPGIDFSGFADEIARTLKIARRSLASFSTELTALRQNLAEAHTGQLAFELYQQEAASSIARRLMATVEIIARQNQRAALAAASVQHRSVNVRQRIGEAVMALQIGDITRQRLEHTSYALGLLDARRPNEWQPPDSGGQFACDVLVRHLQSAQCSDAAHAFDQEVGRIAESLGGLAEEARALRTLGDSAYGASDNGGTSIIAALEDQVGEALALFERFEAARAEVARITSAVAAATTGLHGHLRDVQSLEDDIHIMGLNTTFKCTRIGREGLALSLIAQELRNYGMGFAKEAVTLVGEIENISTMTSALVDRAATNASSLVTAGMRKIQDTVATLRRVGEMLDNSLVDLRRDSEQVITSLDHTVADLAVRDEIGRALRGAAEALAAPEQDGYVNSGDPTPAAERMLALIASGYTMASERTVHERLFGRSITPVEAGVEDVLF